MMLTHKTLRRCASSLSPSAATASAWRSQPFTYTKAIVRALPSTFSAQALRRDPSGTPSPEVAAKQHAEYVRQLSALIPNVVSLPAEDKLPDSVFVEDTCVAIGDTAVICRMSAASRRGEVATVETALKSLGIRTITMQAPAFLDGGDVLFTGSELFVGVGHRSNRAAVAFLQAAFPFLTVTAVPLPPFCAPAGGSHSSYTFARHNRSRRSLASVTRGSAVKKPSTPTSSEVLPLHLKSAVTAISPHVLAVADTDAGRSIAYLLECVSRHPLEFIEVPEPACNVLAINGHFIHQQNEACRDAIDVFEQVGLPHIGVDTSEMAKVDGALTCCSILLH
jgi:dimethylargininase